MPQGGGPGLVRLGGAAEAPDDAILARRNAGVKPKVILEVRQRRVSGQGKIERERGLFVPTCESAALLYGKLARYSSVPQRGGRGGNFGMSRRWIMRALHRGSVIFISFWEYFPVKCARRKKIDEK